jgi:hypothetical protein
VLIAQLDFLNQNVKGDLESLLHSERVLTLPQKFSFMLDTARAMNWLHGYFLIFP